MSLELQLFIVFVALSALFTHRKNYGLAVGFGLGSLWCLVKALPTLIVSNG